MPIIISAGWILLTTQRVWHMMSRSSGTTYTTAAARDMGHRRRYRAAAIGAGLAVLLTVAACSSSKSPSGNTASTTPAGNASSTASAGGGASSAPASSSAPKSTTSVTMGFNSTPDEAYLPLVMAMQTMSKSYDVKQSITFGSDDLALQALSQNKVQFLSDSLPPTASAVAKLPNIVVIGARANNQWDFVSKNSITDCSQLDGKKLGLFSKGGVSTAYVNLYFQKNCPNVKPQTIITPDSTLRRQALVAGQLDATPLQASDAVQVLSTGSDKFHELANFATVFPTIGRDVVLTTKEMVEQHPDQVVAFLSAQLQAIRSIYADPNAGITATQSLLKDSVSGDVSGVVNYFVSHKLWCANGGLADSNIADSLTTFGQGGFLPKDITVTQLVNDGPMKQALAAIGPSSATSC